MSLTVEQDERLTLILQGLEPCLKELYPKARGFVEDQIKRHDEYGKSMFLSPRQSKWLDDLYKEHVGGELPGEGVSDPEHDAREDMKNERDADGFEDDGDEIPF